MTAPSTSCALPASAALRGASANTRTVAMCSSMRPSASCVPTLLWPSASRAATGRVVRGGLLARARRSAPCGVRAATSARRGSGSGRRARCSSSRRTRSTAPAPPGRREHVHVDEVGGLAAAEVFVGDVAATADREHVVGDDQLVVHAAVDARELVQREQHARADAAVAHRQRVEHAQLDVRSGGQAGQQRVFAGGVQIVHQHAHAHAAGGGVAQLTQELPARRVVGDLVVLCVDRLFRGTGQGDAGLECLVAGGQQAHARQVAAAFGRGRGGHRGEAGVGHVGAGLRHGALHAARQAGAAGEHPAKPRRVRNSQRAEPAQQTLRTSGQPQRAEQRRSSVLRQGGSVDRGSASRAVLHPLTRPARTRAASATARELDNRRSTCGLRAAPIRHQEQKCSQLLRSTS